MKSTTPARPADVTDDVESAADYHQVYDAAPVSLWIEDFSGLKVILASWRAAGIVDLDEFLGQNPVKIDEAFALMRVIDVNQTTLGMFKAGSKAELVSRLDEVLGGNIRESFRSELIAMWHGGVATEIEAVNYALDGTPVDILLRSAVLPGHEETWARVLISITDISDRKRSERELAAAREHAAGLFEHSPVSLWLEDYSEAQRRLGAIRSSGVVDLAAHLREHPELIGQMLASIKVLDVNSRTLELFHANDKQELFDRLGDVFGDGDDPNFADELLAMWNGELRHEREIINYTLTGHAIDIHQKWSVLPGHEHTWDRVLVAIVDITVRKRAEAYMQYLGTHDSLTGLFNRTFYDGRLNTLADEKRSLCSVIVADVNGLKLANDSYGHAVGDALIRRASEALREAAHSDDVVARIGGDEFAILMPGKDARAAADLVRRVHEVIEVNNQNYQGPRLSISLGSATAATGSDLAAAHRLADRRMYRDKGDRRRRVGTEPSVA